MTRFAGIVICAVVGLAVACKKGEENPDPAPSGKTASGPAQPAPPPAEPRGPTAAETLERFKACTEAFNRHVAADVVACYATEKVELVALDDVGPDKLDARDPQKISEYLGALWAASPDQTLEPQITIAGPGWVAASVLARGKVGGKPVSALFAQLVWLDDSKRIQRDLRLIDEATLAHQTGAARSPNAPDAETPRSEPVVVVAEPSAAAAVETRIQIVENLERAMASSSLDAVAPHVAEDVVFRYVPHRATTTGKADYMSSLETMSKMFSKVERELIGAMGAGSWVVAHSRVTATPAADLPGAPGSAGKPVTTHQIAMIRFTGTEIAEHWVFENSSQWGEQLK